MTKQEAQTAADYWERKAAQESRRNRRWFYYTRADFYWSIYREAVQV